MVFNWVIKQNAWVVCAVFAPVLTCIGAIGYMAPVIVYCLALGGDWLHEVGTSGWPFIGRLYRLEYERGEAMLDSSYGQILPISRELGHFHDRHYPPCYSDSGKEGRQVLIPKGVIRG
ncbi:MAG TPA: hypothetical protein DCE18_15625 [Syntrophobacteraceae bacterium]|jgi:hypothetical protein|nr:hypothetical protein [Syntrophobacteraceae bacterium]